MIVLVPFLGFTRYEHAPDDRSGVRIFPPLIYLGGLLLGFLIHWRLPLPMVPAVLVGPLRLLGEFCLVAGLALTIWAVATFRRVGTTRHPAGPTTALASAVHIGSRNPMYLGLVFITAGLALLAKALWPLILLPVVIVIVRRAVIDREERYLTTKFGEEYLQSQGTGSGVGCSAVDGNQQRRLDTPDFFPLSYFAPSNGGRSWESTLRPIPRPGAIEGVKQASRFRRARRSTLRCPIRHPRFRRPGAATPSKAGLRSRRSVGPPPPTEGSPTVRRSVIAGSVALSLINNGTIVTHQVDPPDRVDQSSVRNWSRSITPVI